MKRIHLTQRCGGDREHSFISHRERKKHREEYMNFQQQEIEQFFSEGSEGSSDQRERAREMKKDLLDY
jgi:hypothetical protein